MDDTGAPVFFFFSCVVMPKVMCRILLNTGARKRAECLGPEVGP
jgi:hypothetical protein